MISLTIPAGWQDDKSPFGINSLLFGHICPIILLKSIEFIRRAKKYARLHKLEFFYDARHGKGSHGRVIVGKRLTTVKSSNKPLGKGLVRKMLRDLNIEPKDF